jgi:hypothetical protein
MTRSTGGGVDAGKPDVATPNEKLEAQHIELEVNTMK